MPKIQKKKVSCVIRQYHGGKIIKTKKNGVVWNSGGAVQPRISGNELMFHVRRGSDERGKPSLKIARYGELRGGLKINIWGTKNGFVKLAEYLLSVAHVDSRIDENYHEHVDRITSYDSAVAIDQILRRNPRRNWPNKKRSAAEVGTQRGKD